MTDSRQSGIKSNKDLSVEEAVAELRRLIKGFQISQALHVAAVLRVADQMAGIPRSTDEIAAAVGVQPFPLYRLLRALAALGIFREHEGRRFSLTTMGKCLRSDSEQLVGPFAIFMGQEYYQQAWCRLLDSVRTGDTAFVAAHGMSNWQYRRSHPEQNEICNAAMTGNSHLVDGAVIRACNFNDYARIVDLGGGQGSLLAEIMIACSRVRGVLFDQPHVVSGADVILAAAGVLDRCEIVPGDIFESIPGGRDAYVMKFVLHDWNDIDALRILSVCRRDMPATAKLLLIEQFLGPPNQDPIGKFGDLNMLVVTGGQERTREEFEVLLEKGGFRVIDVIRTETPLYVMVAEQGKI
jgi:hypothetical protein